MKPKIIWSQGCKMNNKRVYITRADNGRCHIQVKALQGKKIYVQNLYLKEDTTITLLVGISKMLNETEGGF